MDIYLVTFLGPTHSVYAVLFIVRRFDGFTPSSNPVLAFLVFTNTVSFARLIAGQFFLQFLPVLETRGGRAAPSVRVIRVSPVVPRAVLIRS